MTDSDELLRRAYDPETFRKSGHQLVDRLAQYLEAALRGDMPVLPWRTPDELAAAWPAQFGEEPSPDVAKLIDGVIADAIHQHHSRCFGHQVAVPMPQTALFELVTGLLNNGMASYESGPVSSAMERNVTRWMAHSLGMPETADGVLTSGGTLGNLTALLAARQLCDDYDFQRGSASSKPMAVLASADSHYCIARAAQVMGWGGDGVVSVPLDGAFRMRPDALSDAYDRAIAAGRRVVAVVATTGTSASGAFDPLEPIAAFCRERALWLHVDGAHGASAIFSSKYRHLLDGLQQCDSVVWDAHKLLAMPALVTAVLFRRGESSYAPFAQDADYLFADDEPERWFDYGLRNMECTKRMMSVKLYLALAAVGTAALDRYVTGRFDLARRFAEHIEGEADFELAVEPQCNIVAFRHVPGGAPPSDAQQDRLREAVVRDGGFYLSRTRLAGRTYLRVTLMHPFTSDDDLSALLAAVRTAAGKN